MATTVQTLVSAANQLITDLNTETAFTPGSGTSAGTAGPLLGDPTTEALLSSVLGALSGSTGDQQCWFSRRRRHHDGN